MRPKGWIAFALGLLLLIMGIWTLIAHQSLGAIVPFFIGGSLVYVGWTRSRTATLVFGHTSIVIGCFLVTWGIYLLPHSQPTFAHILGRPLFWGFISISEESAPTIMVSAPASVGKARILKSFRINRISDKKQFLRKRYDFQEKHF
ncbi:MAG: hypothetical protein QME69_10860 [Candidatus Saccharicenans sp.]|nr:hypothetical protein [Candidatus Saccharicenans sp.]